MTPEEIYSFIRAQTQWDSASIKEGIRLIEEYADQEKQKAAVGFAEWLNQDDYNPSALPDVWEHRTGNYTTSDLYALYQKEKGGEG